MKISYFFIAGLLAVSLIDCMDDQQNQKASTFWQERNYCSQKCPFADIRKYEMISSIIHYVIVQSAAETKLQNLQNCRLVCKFWKECADEKFHSLKAMKNNVNPTRKIDYSVDPDNNNNTL
jgi:hypothetical protein